jgi:iron complex transport system permease protein
MNSESSHAFLLARVALLPRLLIICGVLLVLLLLAMIYAASTGATSISGQDVANALLQYIGLDRGVDTQSATYRIVTIVRLPGLMVAALVGAALACAGATMQGLFRNPLADPGIIGVSAGASLGVVLAITQTAALSDLWRLSSMGNALWRVPAAAFVGAMLTSITVYVLSLQRGRTNLAALLLAGVALNSVLGAMTSVLLLRTADASAMRAVLSWLVGSLEGRGWDYFHVAKWPILIASVSILLYSRDLNLLAIGEESAQALGVNVPRARLILLALSSVITASAVSIAGAIGFVGLIVPHILRLIVGPDHRVLLPASALGGAAFLVFADAVARSVIAPEQLPVGIVTSLVGGPFFLFLLWRNRRRIAVF